MSYVTEMIGISQLSCRLQSKIMLSKLRPFEPSMLSSTNSISRLCVSDGRFLRQLVDQATIPETC